MAHFGMNFIAAGDPGIEGAVGVVDDPESFITIEQINNLDPQQKVNFASKAIAWPADQPQLKLTDFQFASGTVNLDTLDESDAAWDSLKNSHAKTLALDKMVEWLHSCNLTCAFKVVFADNVNAQTPNAQARVDLLTSVEMLMVSQVAMSYHLCRASVDIAGVCQTVIWSQTAILSACEQQLKNMVENQMRAFDPEEHGGPLAHRILLDCLFSSDVEMSLCLCDRMNSFNVQVVAGEDVSEILPKIRAGLVCLQNGGAGGHVPAVLVVKIILKTFAAPHFANWICTLEDTESRILNNIMLC